MIEFGNSTFRKLFENYVHINSFLTMNIKQILFILRITSILTALWLEILEKYSI